MNPKNTIKVYARVKPSEQASHYYDVKESNDDEGKECLLLHRHKKNTTCNKTYRFKFQKVFSEKAAQFDLYCKVAKPVVDKVFDGYNGSILAYGQTGTGKTHSIAGGETETTMGMIPRAFQHIFDLIDKIQSEEQNKAYSIAISIMEIYNELCYDLLSKNDANCHDGFTKVGLLEDAAGNVKLRNLIEYPVNSMDDVYKYLKTGMTNRVVADTPMNQVSSRSHCVFTMYLTQKVKGEKKHNKAKLHMIDLSGSERTWKNSISGHLMHEARHINLSLHYLEQVIVALSDPNRSHVPYRNSTITSFLRDTLGGNSCTAMVFTISLEPDNFCETLSTCRFSQRVSMVKNKQWRDIEYDRDEEVAFLKLEIERLRKIIEENGLSIETNDVNKCSIEKEEEENTTTDEIKTGDVDYGNDFEESLDDSHDEISSSRASSCNCSKKQGKHLEKTNSYEKDLISNAGDSNASSYRENLTATVNHINKGINLLSSLTKEASYVVSLAENSLMELIDPQQIIAILGLELPEVDSKTESLFTNDQKEAYGHFVSLPEIHEKIKRYASMNVSYCKLIESEWYNYKQMDDTIKNKESAELQRSKLLEVGRCDQVSDLAKLLEKIMMNYEKFKDASERIRQDKQGFHNYFKTFRIKFLNCFTEWYTSGGFASLKQAKQREKSEKLMQERILLNNWARRLSGTEPEPWENNDNLGNSMFQSIHMGRLENNETDQLRQWAKSQARNRKNLFFRKSSSLDDSEFLKGFQEDARDDFSGNETNRNGKIEGFIPAVNNFTVTVVNKE